MIKASLKNVDLSFPIIGKLNFSIRKYAVEKLVGGNLAIENNIVKIHALKNITFEAQEGDRIGFYGHNGSGKTTLLRVILGIIKPDSGNISVSGNLTSMLSLNMGVDPSFTGLEIIKLKSKFLKLNSLEEEELVNDVKEFSELGDYIHLPLSTYSSGMSMRLSFAIATHKSSDIIILDEWLSAGDISFQPKAQDRMKNLIKNTGILFLASHDIKMLKNICNKIYFLEKGSIVKAESL
jgi:lipopolysaccharide transport system ATP-binding protein